MKESELNTRLITADLYEMANLDGRDTGLKYSVFVSSKGGAKHECRVKVSNIRGKNANQDCFVISLKDLEVCEGICKLNSDDLEAVKWWIHRNRFPILDLWKGVISTGEFFRRIRPLKEKNSDDSVTE